MSDTYNSMYFGIIPMYTISWDAKVPPIAGRGRITADVTAEEAQVFIKVLLRAGIADIRLTAKASPALSQVATAA